jgi:hypothetical protein
MVRIRASESGRNTHPPEGINPPPGGMPSNQEHVVAMEARIAQMSRDVATLTEQNIWLLGQIQGERVHEESDENYDGESNVHASRNTEHGSCIVVL